nr:hypothetical protein 6 [Pelagibacterales bacterium]
MEERSSHSTYSTYQHMIPLILSTLLTYNTPTPTLVEQQESWSICEQIEPELQQAVEFDIITPEQMNAVLIRCLINYS